MDAENMICTTYCGPGRFENKLTWSCYACDTSCARCSGPDASQCVSCAQSYYFSAKSGLCEKVCEDSHFGNNIGRVCTPCMTHCQACINYTTCLNCSNISYYDNATETCKPCDETCTSCSGPGKKGCSACSRGELIPSGECLVCSSSQYYNGEVRRCDSCHLDCETCSGPKNSDCTSCINRILKDGYCLECLNIRGKDLVGLQCEEICGDGIRLTTEVECDDGNHVG